LLRDPEHEQINDWEAHILQILSNYIFMKDSNAKMVGIRITLCREQSHSSKGPLFGGHMHFEPISMEQHSRDSHKQLLTVHQLDKDCLSRNLSI
jgi:hypothetical protein